MGKETKKLCFVITPIGDNESNIRRHIDGIIDQAIYPALENKFEISVAHRKYEIGSINDRIIKEIYEADLVIANLTDKNPNVMYELAIRYSFAKPAIVIAEKGTKLPFDVIDENTIFYVNDPSGAAELKKHIVEYEKNIDYEKKNYGPVYKVINKIPLYKDIESGEKVSTEQSLEYIIDRLKYLESSINSLSKLQDKSISLANEENKKYAIIIKFMDLTIKREEILDKLEEKIKKSEVMCIGTNTSVNEISYNLIGKEKSIKNIYDDLLNETFKYHNKVALFLIAQRD